MARRPRVRTELGQSLLDIGVKRNCPDNWFKDSVNALVATDQRRMCGKWHTGPRDVLHAQRITHPTKILQRKILHTKSRLIKSKVASRPKLSDCCLYMPPPIWHALVNGSKRQYLLHAPYRIVYISVLGSSGPMMMSVSRTEKFGIQPRGSE